MTLAALCAAAIELSDNTAANLILASLGGPPGWTRFVRSLGDAVTRLDRNEPRSTPPSPAIRATPPRRLAMVGRSQDVLLGDALSPASRERLRAG